MYCQRADFLRATMIIDDVRLRALDAEVDLEAVQTSAQAIVEACGEKAACPGERRAGDPIRHVHRPAEHRRPALPDPCRRDPQPERTLVDLMSRLVARLAEATSE